MTTQTIEELQAKLEAALSSIEKLETKNKEILEEKKRAAAEAETAREAAEEAAEANARAAKDVEGIEKAITKKFEKQIADLTRQNTDKEATLKTLLIDTAIQSSLVENGIAPAYHKAVTAMLKAEARIDGGEAKIGDVALVDHIKGFVASDEGKAFVTAAANSGANATGSKATSARMTKETFNLTKFMEIAASNPTEANSLADSLGMPHLKIA